MYILISIESLYGVYYFNFLQISIDSRPQLFYIIEQLYYTIEQEIKYADTDSKKKNSRGVF